MKKILVIASILFTATLSAQEIEPKFEKEGNFIKGTFFHDNGNIQQQGIYKDGKLHGEWRMYNEEGKKISLGKYDNGKKTGKWFFWEDNQLKEVDYNNNSIAEVTEWKNNTSVASNE